MAWLSGCKSHQYVTGDNTKDSSSVTTQIKVRDTAIHLPASKVVIEDSGLYYAGMHYAYNNIPGCPPCPEIKPFHQVTHSGRASNSLTVTAAGKVIDTCNCDTASIMAKVYDRVVRDYESHKENKTVVITPSAWQKFIEGYKTFCTWGFSIELIIAIMLLIFRILVGKLPFGK